MKKKMKEVFREFEFSVTEIAFLPQAWEISLN